MMKKNLRLIVMVSVLTIILVSVALAAGPKPAPQIGRVAPDFSLKSTEGSTINLKSVIGKNKVTILNFWATWCPPCRGEIPEFVEFAQKYQSEKVALVAVNLQEDSKKVREFANNAGMNFPILLDSNGKVAQTYQIYAIPTTLFIDGSGVVREKVEGALSLSRLESIYRKLSKN
mgnify:CR=1 FL=1